MENKKLKIATLTLTVVIGLAFALLGIFSKVAVIDGKSLNLIDILTGIAKSEDEVWFSEAESKYYDMSIFSSRVYLIIMKICLIALPITFAVYIGSLVMFFTGKYNWIVVTVFVFDILVMIGCSVMAISETSHHYGYLENYAENCTYTSLAGGGYLFAFGIWGCIGYWILIALYYVFNLGYKGKAPMNYFQKILEVFIQILLIPVSLFFTFFTIGITVGGPWWVHFVVAGYWEKYKAYSVESGHWYSVGESDRQVEKTVKNDIRDNYGHIIGTYETKEYETVHDSGDRYALSTDQFMAGVYGLVALPCRVVSLALSLIALFVPKLYVKVGRPENGGNYSEDLFLFFDLIVY